MPFLKITNGNDDELYPCSRVSVHRNAGSIVLTLHGRGDGCPETVTLPADGDKAYLVDAGITVTGWVWPPRTTTALTNQPTKEL